jgi:threonylcarbamoyladenosine tRNA methylthiotransferase MtaB
VKVALYTLGCKLNFSETSEIGRQLSRKGFLPVEFSEFPDVYVINTCSVTENADKKCRKLVSQALRINPQAQIVIMGCYAQLKPEAISNIPGVSMVLGASDKFRLPEILQSFVPGSSPTIHHQPIQTANSFSAAYSVGDRTRSFLKVQDGCDYKCTFCTIPLARGASRSDTLEHVLLQAAEIAEAGVQEIVLTGVNLGDYGKEFTYDFFDLIKALEEQGAVPRFRISSIEPNLLHPEIIDFVAGSKHFMPHFHMPLQSGSNAMLAAMKRRYRKELYSERVEQIHAQIPHAGIGVDVITGFPGETEEHFQETYSFLESLPVSYLHVFTYSERENTVAATLPGKVPVSIRQERTQRLIQLSESKKKNFTNIALTQIRPVLWESEESKGKLSGLTDNYIRVNTLWDPILVNEITPTYLKEALPDSSCSGLPQIFEPAVN